MKKVLLTFPYQVDEKVTVEKDGIDNWNLSFTRGQGIFALPDKTPVIPLHLLAQNIKAPTVVLEYPSLEDYISELKNNYDYIGITYTIPHTDRVIKMAQLAKEMSPDSKIIIGGYGNQCFSQEMKSVSELDELTDYVCRGEGISFMRKLLCEPDEKPIKQLFPLGGFMPYNKWFLAIRHFYLSISLGCQFGCEFCATSAYFDQKKIYLLNPKECFEAIKQNLKKNPGVHHCLMYDEDFLMNKKYVDELGSYLRNDPFIQKRNFSYYCFASVKAISQYTPEELIENGITGLYLGVESCLSEQLESKMAKRSGMSINDVFEMLNKYGIVSIGTYILGWDFHTKENIITDINHYVDLKPTMIQVRPLLAIPQTRLWEEKVKEGRLSDQDKEWKNVNLFSRSFKYKNFTPDEVFNYIDVTAKKVNDTHGPTSLRLLDLIINGYNTLNNSSNPYLQRRADFLAKKARLLYPALAAVKAFPYNENVYELAMKTSDNYENTFGKPSLLDKLMSKMSKMFAKKRKQELEKTRNIVPLPPFKRYQYNQK